MTLEAAVSSASKAPPRGRSTHAESSAQQRVWPSALSEPGLVRSSILSFVESRSEWSRLLRTKIARNKKARSIGRARLARPQLLAGHRQRLVFRVDQSSDRLARDRQDRDEVSLYLT